jgi:hypothetical protein
MDAPTLLRTSFRDLHEELLADVDGLDDETLFWQPAEGQNHIGFLLWHLIRDEDAVICQSVLERDELWSSSGWAARFGMDAKEQGTGMSPSSLGHFRYALGDLLAYADAVWEQTDDALEKLDPQRLEESLSWSNKWRLANLLTTGRLAHGWVHLGEIRQIRGLRGWRFRE